MFTFPPKSGSIVLFWNCPADTINFQGLGTREPRIYCEILSLTVNTHTQPRRLTHNIGAFSIHLILDLNERPVTHRVDYYS